MAEASDCKRQIVKIAENNVELQFYLLSPVTGERVPYAAMTIGYGQEKIDTDRATADTEWSFWDGLDAVGISDKIKDAADDVELYDKLQQVMDAVDGTVIDLD